MSIATQIANPEMESGAEQTRARAPADVAAWFDEALPRIYGYFLPRVGGRVAVAEDLTQETILAAVRSGHRPVRPDAVIPWLFGIARYKLMDHYRREDRERRRFGRLADVDRIECEAAPPLPNLDLDAMHTRDTVVAILDWLPPRQRSALVARYLDGCDVPATAELLGVSVHAAESLLARARASFRQRYRDLNGDPS